MNKEQRTKNKEQKQKMIFAISKVGAKGLRIAVSTIAIVELLRQDYPLGISASVSWILLTFVFKKIYNDE